MTEIKNCHCFICDELLTRENASLEHIILNSCGGRLRSKRLLCKKCNSRIGAEGDSELAKQLNFFSTFLNIERDNGELQKIKGFKDQNGKEYTLLPGEVNKPILSKPKVDKKDTGKKIEINISASDMKTIEKVLKDLNRKYPQFDIAEARNHLVETNRYLSQPLHLASEVGGDLAFRSIAKTAVGFYILSGGKTKSIKQLVPFIIGDDVQDVVWFAHIENPYLIDPDEVSHFLYVKADRTEKIAFAFVDFFNSYSFFICLSDNYEGESFENTYCYDLMNKKLLQKKFLPILDRQQVLVLTTRYQPTREQFMIIQNRIQRVLMIAEKRQLLIEGSRLVKESLNTTLQELGNPETFTEEVLKRYIDELVKNIVPLLISRKNLGQ